MTDVVEDWPALFRYGPNNDDVDCYYLFAPVRDGDIRLIQLDVMLAYAEVLRCFVSVVMADGVVHHFRRVPAAVVGSNDRSAIVRHAGRFRLEVGGLVVLTNEGPDRFRIEATDPANGLHADLHVCPRVRHAWPTVGYDYFTSLESVVDGTITMNDRPVAISTRAAFEHATYEPADDPEQAVRLPPFWHYEYVTWTDGDDGPSGSILGNVLDQAGGHIDPAGFATSCPAGIDTSYDSYEVTYSDVEEYEGNLVPMSWEVTATKGPECLTYRSQVSAVASSTPRDAGFLMTFLLECEGEYRGTRRRTLTPWRRPGRVHQVDLQPGRASVRRIAIRSSPRHDREHGGGQSPRRTVMRRLLRPRCPDLGRGRDRQAPCRALLRRPHCGLGHR